MLFLFTIDDIESDGCVKILRDADHVSAVNPFTGEGLSIDGQLHVPPGTLPGYPACEMIIVQIIAKTPKEQERAIAATKCAKKRMLDIERLTHFQM